MSEESTSHAVKNTTFFGRSVPILCQNQNGPCPLLAILNILILRNQLSLPTEKKSFPVSALVDYVANSLIELNQTSNSAMQDDQKANLEQNLSDVMTRVVPMLQYGLDVNVRFNAIDDWEFTQEMVIFDLLDIPLVHGWLLDPQDTETFECVGKKSYNQLVETIIECQDLVEKVVKFTIKSDLVDAIVVAAANEEDSNSTIPEAPAEDVELLHRSEVVDQFLETSASQLTYYGLHQLQTCVKERQLCVFFRNNHFSTLFKLDGQLYLLVTDEGYIDEPNVVWEKLTDIGGNTEYFKADFQPLFSSEVTATAVQPIVDVPITTTTPEDADYMLALKLQEEERSQQEEASQAQQQQASQQRPPPQTERVEVQDGVQFTNEGEIRVTREQMEAQRREEELYFRQQQHQQHQRQKSSHRSSRRRDKEDGCTLQ